MDKRSLLDTLDGYGVPRRSLEESRADLRAAEERMRTQRPALERPFQHEDENLLKYELAVRKGPYARCSGCGWMPHEYVDLQRADLMRCPSCGETGKICRWKRWAPALIATSERGWDWARRTAEALRLQWPSPREGGGDG